MFNLTDQQINHVELGTPWPREHNSALQWHSVSRVCFAQVKGELLVMNEIRLFNHLV